MNGEKRPRRWPKVVGIILLLVLIVGGGVAVVIGRQVSAGKREFQALMRDIVTRCEEEDLVPAEQLVVLRDLADIANREDTSIFGVLLCSGLVSDALADEEISEEELADLTLVRDFAKEQEGGLGFANCGRFFTENPRIQEKFQSMKTREAGWFEMDKWRRGAQTRR